MSSAPRVVIIGGGVIGAAIAWTLGELGVTDVDLVEKRHLASGATGICPGGLRQQFEGEADCVLARHSLRFYEAINQHLSPDYPFTIERSGYLFLARSEARLDRFRQNVAMQNGLGIPSAVIGPDDVRRLIPSLQTEEIAGAAFCAEDGFLEDCHGVTTAFAAAARRRGLRISYAEVVRIEPIGRRWRVSTAVRQFEADHVVVAAGAESVQLMAPFHPLPVQAERRRLAYSAPVTRGQLAPLTVDLEGGFAIKQLASGVFYMGWLGEDSHADDLTFTEETLTRGARLLPQLLTLPVARVMGGLYDNTPDHRPLLGAVDGVDGLWVAAGFSGHGFMIAPAAAEIVAHAICGRPTTLPAEAFALRRFATRHAEEGLFI